MVGSVNKIDKGYPIFVTIYRKRANGVFEITDDRGKMVALDGLNYLALKNERTIAKKQRNVVISNPTKAKTHPEFFNVIRNEEKGIEERLKDKTPEEIEAIRKEKPEPPTPEKREEIIKVSVDVPETLKELSPLKRYLFGKGAATRQVAQMLLELREFTPTRLDGLTIEELEKAYRTSVFETHTDGTLHVKLLEGDNNNFYFLVPVISGQQLRLLPVISEELLQWLVNKVKETYRKWGKEPTWFDKFPWLLPAIMCFVFLVGFAGAFALIGPPMVKGIMSSAGQGIADGFARVFGHITINIDNVSAEQANRLLSQYHLVLARGAENVTTTTILAPPGYTGG